ncbi:hypothetical protein QTP88_010083 [Uroleucon formosanum]
MLSDADIADQLDEILANPQSEDEFMDEIDLECDDDDFDMNSLVSQSSPKPIDTQPNVPSFYQSLETVSPGVERAKKYRCILQISNGSLIKIFTQKHLILTTLRYTNSGVQKHEFNLHKNSSILEFFDAFVLEFLIGKVAFETNIYAQQFLQHNVILEHSRSKAWNDVNIGKLYVFIATTFLMARNKKLDMKDNWSNDPLLHTPIFGKIMSRDRYLLILKIIHFCNNENQVSGNRLFKLDMVLDEVKANFKAAMVPFQNLVIDGSLVLWKGRLSFKQFIKSKRHRFGIKFFVLCDVETDYILDFIIYTGAETRLIPYDKNIGGSGGVVKILIAPYLNKGYNLYTDNWLAVGGVQSSHTKNLMVLKWLDRREVFMLSTLFNNKLGDSGKVDKNGVNIKKPKCIVNYNACMGSIDKTDMLHSSVECVRKTLKWGRKIFFHLIDLCLLNAFFIYKTVTIKSMSLVHFQLEVIRQLLEKYSTPKESPNRGRPSTKDQPLRLSGRHFPSDISTSNSEKTNRRCAVCIKNKIYGPHQISNLATIKDRGRIKKPSKNVVKICQTAEQVFRKYSKSVAFSKRDREIYDGYNHYPKKVSTNHPPRCHDADCKRHTRYICCKCQEPVCPECMENFYTK